MNKNDKDYWVKAWRYMNCKRVLSENMYRNGCDDRYTCVGCMYRISFDEFSYFHERRNTTKYAKTIGE